MHNLCCSSLNLILSQFSSILSFFLLLYGEKEEEEEEILHTSLSLSLYIYITSVRMLTQSHILRQIYFGQANIWTSLYVHHSDTFLIDVILLLLKWSWLEVWELDVLLWVRMCLCVSTPRMGSPTSTPQTPIWVTLHYLLDRRRNKTNFGLDGSQGLKSVPRWCKKSLCSTFPGKKNSETQGLKYASPFLPPSVWREVKGLSELLLLYLLMLWHFSDMSIFLKIFKVNKAQKWPFELSNVSIGTSVCCL